MRTFLFSLAGGVVGGVAVYAIAAKVLEKQFASGGQSLAQQLDLGRGELDARLLEGQRQLKQQIESEVRQQVPPVVRRELESTLRSYNITPTTGRQISTVLGYADRVGLI